MTTRDFETEGPVIGQQRIDVDHCEPCPFAACLACPYKGGTWGDEKPEPKPTREEPTWMDR